jgi:hypothetical protein
LARSATAATTRRSGVHGIKRGLLVGGQQRADRGEILRAGLGVFGESRLILGVGFGGRVELGRDLGLLLGAQTGDGHFDSSQSRGSLDGSSAAATASAATASGTASTATTAAGSASAGLGKDIGGNEAERESAEDREGFQG